MLTITTLVHPNTNAGQPGYRFAVHVTGPGVAVDPAELGQVLNAGWAPERWAAEVAGADQAATARAAILKAAELTELTDLIPTLALADLYTDTDHYPPPAPE